MAVENEKEEPDLVAIADDGKPVSEEEDTRASPEPDEETDEEEEEEEEEQRLGAAEGDDREELRGKRKEERHDRRSRQKQARDRDSKEMAFLRSRNEILERRFSEVETRVAGTELSAFDREINIVKGNLLTADQVISRAIASGKGEDAVEAMRIRDGLRDRFTQLSQAKASVSKRPANEPDPALLSHARDWTSKHSWWDPNGGDEDSLIVSAIDTALVNGGFDPKTPKYWDELTKRVEKRLPHRAAKGKRREEEPEEEEDDDNVGNQREGGNGKARGGPRFRTGGRERPLKKNEVYISADRKEAMVEAGVWDDPQLRQRYLKQYAQYDREHSNA